MAIGSQQELLTYVAEDVKKNESINYPVRATYFERLFVSHLPVKWLHPNPDDEFSNSTVGPSFRTINDYREQARDNRSQERPYFNDSIIVEKMSTGGYMIINGHHRWAAASLEGIKFVRVRIVNLTHIQDFHHMLDKSVRDKRVVMDLDQVIFSTSEDDQVEKNPNIIGRLLYREKVKIGRIALLNALHRMGYDIWVYTRGYRSSEYIEKLFSFYTIKIDGIINGIGRPQDEEAAIKLKESFERKYIRSLHIDSSSVSYIKRDTRQLIIKDIESDDLNWSRAVLDIMTEIEKE